MRGTFLLLTCILASTAGCGSRAGGEAAAVTTTSVVTTTTTSEPPTTTSSVVVTTMSTTAASPPPVEPVVDAWGNSIVDPPEGLALRLAVARPAITIGERFDATLTITNHTDQPITLTYPSGCVSFVSLYRSGKAVAHDENTGCTTALYDRTYPPGDTVMQAGSVLASSDPVPSGEYDLFVGLDRSGSIVWRAPTVRVILR